MPRKKVLATHNLDPHAMPPPWLGDLDAILDAMDGDEVLAIRRYVDPAATPPPRGFHAVEDLTAELDEIEAEDLAAAFVEGELQRQMELRRANSM